MPVSARITPHPIESQSRIVIQPQPSTRSYATQVQKIVTPHDIIPPQTTIMFPQSLIKAVRPAARLTIQSRSAFTTSTRVMAGGDTGAPPKTGGQGYVSQAPEWSLELADKQLLIVTPFKSARRPTRTMPSSNAKKRSSWS